VTHVSSKTYGHEIGLSCCFRQWRAESHCRFLHGYALSVRVDFVAKKLDKRNWVVDFGGLKTFKELLQESFDHKLVVAEDDPLIATFRELEIAGAAELVVMPAVGCEAFAEFIYDAATQWLSDNGYAPRVRVAGVEVREHGANSASFLPG
jgi:6-pyruvoyltetrahydropterin/6-carboxytetrahydropterin synthase